MKITCPHCGSGIAPGDINVQATIAKCAYCGEVFSFVKQVGGTVDALPSKAPVEMPKGISISNQLDDTVITRTWFSWQYIGLLIFCIFWDGLLVFWYSIGFHAHAPLIMFVFPLLHVAAGVFLTYTMLAGFFNHTEFRINNRWITVRHFPLPWPGNKTMPVENVEQLFCEEKVVRGRNGTSHTYSVMVIMNGAERLVLVSGLEQPNHARFIEQEIESRLGIADRLVAGEMNVC